jgi:hypothetical protein
MCEGMIVKHTDTKVRIEGGETKRIRHQVGCFGYDTSQFIWFVNEGRIERDRRINTDMRIALRV